MNSAQLRQAFLDFFAGKGHEIVASSSLVPGDDPTLLFTNAGMVQFKDVFTGKEKRPYKTATSSQRCVRAGGKHNDLENVGYTSRHHTFFEMLGNFSFGDYFKQEAIEYAWEFLTKDMQLPAERLWITVYEEDDEAADIWLNDIGVDPARFTRLGMKDNFWAMGDTGPCGPCSEIFYDYGPDVSGGPPGSADEEGDRYIEIWNLVFMQFDRSADGKMTPLPKPSVDTGMGLERMAAVMQGTTNNYAIDLFKNLIKSAAKLTGTKDLGNNSLQVIADHIRACSFLICDGVLPANDGRGYVLRRIIRRAIRHGFMLGMEDAFFHKLVKPLVKEMGAAYPELKKAESHIEKMLLQEERRFAETLSHGMGLLEAVIAGLEGKEIPGDTVFKLYDTYGFPLDLTADIAREKGLSIDRKGFEQAMDGQRSKAKAASKFGQQRQQAIELDVTSEFTGHESLANDGRVVALFDKNGPADTLGKGQTGQIVLDSTPFYGESGGQVGDTGVLSAKGVEFRVEDCRKSGDAIVHVGTVTKGSIDKGDQLAAAVDAGRRNDIVLNHSATHLLHAALRTLLGDQVSQKGSLVAPDRLRFDFSHFEPLSAEKLVEIESWVNLEIRKNTEARSRTMSYDDAIGAGAMALFGEKYGDRVRVMNMGDFSTELCGGTHVRRTGDIGFFKITQETGVASGVRRIEAVTGEGAMAWLQAEEDAIDALGGMLKASRGELAGKVRNLVERNRQLEKELTTLRGQLASGQGTDPVSEAVDVHGVKVLARRIDGADAKALRDAVDQFKNKLGSSVVVLGAADNGKVRLAAGVSKDQLKVLDAGRIIGAVAEAVGGKGGGRPDFAQAGGNDPSKLDEALASVSSLVEAALSG
ncbi:MAG: alanine--tRNA ligase [Gammaproteobacteria bacterium]|nr:alanine--tRNA ligase [Gammaproteobacteria bacterium]MCZ6881147.1 alanine--tRNA ligase [Gammaproteobacteria bacterium]